MERTSINTDYYWDGISDLCGELLNEMETLVRDKYNGVAEIGKHDIYSNVSKITKLYFYKDEEDVVLNDELVYEREDGFIGMVREMEIDKMLEIAETL